VSPWRRTHSAHHCRRQGAWSIVSEADVGRHQKECARLDGTTDRDGLLAAVLDLFRQNVFQVNREGEEMSNPSEIEEALADEVDAMPQRLVELKLLSNRDA
jgi:hypothetical protein